MSEGTEYTVVTTIEEESMGGNWAPALGSRAWVETHGSLEEAMAQMSPERARAGYEAAQDGAGRRRIGWKSVLYMAREDGGAVVMGSSSYTHRDELAEEVGAERERRMAEAGIDPMAMFAKPNRDFVDPAHDREFIDRFYEGR